MKFRITSKATSTVEQGIVETVNRTTLPLQPNQSIKPAQDKEAFKKTLYQSLSVFLSPEAGPIQDYAKLLSTLKIFSKSLSGREELIKLCEMAINDVLKGLRHRIYKADILSLTSDQQTLSMAMGLAQLLLRVTTIEQKVVEDCNFLNGYLFGRLLNNQIQVGSDQSNKDFFQTFLKALFTLLMTILGDDPNNFDQLMQETDIGILVSRYLGLTNPFTTQIEQLIIQLFSEKVPQGKEITAYNSLDKCFGHAFRAPLRRIFFTQIVNLEFSSGHVTLQIKNFLQDPNQTNFPQLLGRYCSGVEDSTAQKFFTIFADCYKAHIKTMHANNKKSLMSLLIGLFDTFKAALFPQAAQASPIAPAFLSYIVQLNQQILRGFNHSIEIANDIEQQEINTKFD